MEKTSLPAGWEIKKLPEISEDLDRKRIPITKSKRIAGSIPYYGASGVVDYVEGFLFDEDLLLVSEDGANLLARKYPIAFSICGKTWVNNHAHILKFEDSITQKFTELYLNSIKLDNFISGMAQPKLNKTKLNSIPIPIPPLPQQKQIVSTLDKAFAAIETAKANAEENLQNAKELFESYLQNVFENKGDDWEEKTLGEVVVINTGKLNSNAMEEDGKYPFFTCSRKIFAINEYAFDCKAVLLAGNNASGDFNVKYYEGKFNAYQRTYVITVNSENELLYSYLKHKLLFHLSVFKKQSVGANTKFLKLGMIKGVKIILPPIEQQNKIIKKLDSQSEKTKKLEAIYTQKTVDLEEMKKSVLQKAFSGQLGNIN